MKSITSQKNKSAATTQKKNSDIVSYRMSRIRSKDTSIELALRRALSAIGLRYRKNYKKAIGSPDVAFVARKIAIFCDSSFWHGKDWPTLRRRLQRNGDFWVNKIKRNIARDRRVNRELSKAGWIILRFWDADIERRIDWCTRKVLQALDQRKQT